MLKIELTKVDVLPTRILITHPKPQYYDVILREITELGVRGVELLRDGTIYDI